MKTTLTYTVTGCSSVEQARQKMTELSGRDIETASDVDIQCTQFKDNMTMVKCTATFVDMKPKDQA